MLRLGKLCSHGLNKTLQNSNGQIITNKLSQLSPSVAFSSSSSSSSSLISALTHRLSVASSRRAMQAGRKMTTKSSAETPASSSTPQSAAAAARAARRASASTSSTSSTTASTATANKQVITPATAAVILAMIGVYAAAFNIRHDPTGPLGTLYEGSIVQQAVQFVYNNTYKKFEEVLEPVSDSILPEPLPDQFTPPLLVLDLEKCIIGTEYTASNGYRHVVRPGFKDFLKRIVKYYEVVIISEQDLGAAAEIFMAIDPDHYCTWLGNTSAEFKDNVYLKRLDLMNRPLNKIILIDDSPDSSKLFPRNTLLIKPYDDVNDVDDHALTDLLPLLYALCHDGVEDFRATLDDLGTRVAEEAVVEYEMRVAARKQAERAKKDRGLGKIIRSQIINKQQSTTNTTNTSSSSDDDESSNSSARDILKKLIDQGQDGEETASTTKTNTDTASKLSGVKGYKEPEKKSNLKKKGALFDWIEEKEKEKEAIEMEKREKMNEIYNKKMMEKKKKEEEEERKRRRNSEDM